MPRYIDADEFVKRVIQYPRQSTKTIGLALADTPTADVVERKKGKWIEKQVIHAEEAKEVVEEWQSCRCSICGHYNTQPYMYYFSEPNYCSFCGASMKEEATNAQLD